MERSALPKPNVTYLSPSTDVIDEKSIKGMICNPIYAGLPSFPQIVSDEAWVQAATQLIDEEGPEQFLVNLLYVLRESMNSRTNHETTKAITTDNEVNSVPAPSSPTLYCYHDDFPMIELHGTYVCVAEYIFEHLDNVAVTDLISKPEPALVFQNGHTLPLLSPASSQVFSISDEDVFLNSLNNLGIVDVEWDDDQQAIILYFGPSIVDDIDPVINADNADDETIPLEAIAVHLDSVRQMTCPYLSNVDLTIDD